MRVVAGRLYICGGVRVAAAVDTASVFDPDLDKWEALSPMAQPRSGAAAAVLWTA